MAHSFWYGFTNKKWVLTKVLYFFVSACDSVYYPFIVIFYLSLGLTIPQIGVIEFISIAISIVSRPLLGSIADLSGRHSLVFSFLWLAFAIPMASLIFIPVTLPSSPANISENVSVTFSESMKFISCELETIKSLANRSISFIHPEVGNLSTGQCALACHQPSSLIGLNFTLLADPDANLPYCRTFSLVSAHNIVAKSGGNETCLLSCIQHIEPPDNSLTFMWTCGLRSISAISYSPAFSLLDSMAYDILGEGNSAFWGQQRMFSTVAWAIFAGITGVVISKFKTFAYSFGAFAVFSLIVILIGLFWLPKRLGKIPKKEKIPFFKAIRQVSTSVVLWAHCVVAIFSGTFFGVIQIAWVSFMKDLGASEDLLGLNQLIMCTLAIPTLFVAGQIVEKIGAFPCYLMTFACYTARFALTAFLTPSSLWAALAIETFQIVCFPIYLTAATKTAAMIAPPGTSSTIQALFATCYFGFGNGLGVLFASQMYERFGGRIAFFYFAASAFGAFLLTLLFYLIYFRKNLRRTTAKRTDDQKVSTGQIDSLVQGTEDGL